MVIRGKPSTALVSRNLKPFMLEVFQRSSDYFQDSILTKAPSYNEWKRYCMFNSAKTNNFLSAIGWVYVLFQSNLQTYHRSWWHSRNGLRKLSELKSEINLIEILIRTHNKCIGYLSISPSILTFASSSRDTNFPLVEILLYLAILKFDNDVVHLIWWQIWLRIFTFVRFLKYSY